MRRGPATSSELTVPPRWKRVLDLGLVVVTAPLTLPLALVTATALLISQGPPLFYRHDRSGMHGATFSVIKFRTMGPERGRDGRVLLDHERVGRVGRLVRRLSLDELPQLINVANGTMSFVGPRPLPVRYTAAMRDREKIRFLVRPGITGLSQVSGRNSLTWDERLELDARYVESLSLLLDLQILVRTLVVVAGARGYTETAQLSMDDLDVERSRGPLEGGDPGRG